MLVVFFCVSKNVSVSCAYTQGKREQFSGFNRTLDAINNVFRKFSAFHDETGRLNVDGMNIISNDGSNKLNRSRKIGRAVQQECRDRYLHSFPTRRSSDLSSASVRTSVFPARTRKVNANNSAALTGRSTPLIMFSVNSAPSMMRQAV